MSAWDDEIEKEALKLIRRFENYARALAEEKRRQQRRTTEVINPLLVLRPKYWDLADGFDPYLVRARSKRIAHSIQRAVVARQYKPRNSILYSVLKPGGGTRSISVFQVADAAVSRRIFYALMQKNRPRMSSHTYAYRDDISAHDAIHYVSSELYGVPRVFVAEYDFSKFFDNISHEYLWRIIHDNNFLVTPAEKAVIQAFLNVPALADNKYVDRSDDTRDCGVPQGTSVSLFLANIAAWELDRALERLGVSFVRYADDTLIWSTDYTQICRAAEALHVMSERIGAPLNFAKSGGIRLLTPVGAPAEFQHTGHVDFLGHRICCTKVSIKPTLVEKIKSRIHKLLYFNLIRAARKNSQEPNRLGGVDRDYTAYIWQLRRFLYGDISERGLRRMRSRGTQRRRFRGLMSFFPLVNDWTLLRYLDRWLLCVTYLALQKRSRLLTASGFRSLPTPHGEPCDSLPSLVGISATTGEKVDLRLPSFIRIGKIIERAVRQHGPTMVAQGLRYEYT